MPEGHADSESFVSQDSWIREEPQAYDWDGASNDDGSEDDERARSEGELLPKAASPPPPEPADDDSPSYHAQDRDAESDSVDQRSEMSWAYTASESEYGQPLDFVIEGAHVAERIAAQRTTSAANVPVQFYVSSGEENAPPLHFPLADSSAEEQTSPRACESAVQAGGTSDEVLSDSSFILERAARFAVEAPPRNFERYMHTAVTVPPRYGVDALVDERPAHHIDASERHRIRAQLRQLGPLGAQLQVRGPSLPGLLRLLACRPLMQPLPCMRAQTLALQHTARERRTLKHTPYGEREAVREDEWWSCLLTSLGLPSLEELGQTLALTPEQVEHDTIDSFAGY